MNLDELFGISLLALMGIIAAGAFIGAAILAGKAAWWLITGAIAL